MANHYTLNTLMTKGVQIYHNSDTDVYIFLIDGKAVKVGIESFQQEAEFQKKAYALLRGQVPKLLSCYEHGLNYFLVQEYIQDSERLYDLQYAKHPTRYRRLPPHMTLEDVSQAFTLSRHMAVGLMKGGINHGDLHTANMLTKKVSGVIKPYMIDFGKSIYMDKYYCKYVYDCFKDSVFDKVGLSFESVCDILLNRLEQPYDPPDLENVTIILAYLCNSEMNTLFSCKAIGCFPNFLAFWFDPPWDTAHHGITCMEDHIMDIEVNMFRRACRKSFDIRKCEPYAKAKPRSKTKRTRTRMI